jgi:hypothetical protein
LIAREVVAWRQLSLSGKATRQSRERACAFYLTSTISSRSLAKRRDSRFHSGRSRDWIKIKNVAHPAIERALLIAFSKRRTRR